MCTGTHDFIPAENTAKLEIIVDEFQQRMENVVYVRYESEPSESQIRTLAESAIGAWATNIAPLISNNVTLLMCKATSVANEDSFGYEAEPAEVTTGEVAVAGLPNNVTVATKFGSGLTGRSNRGRAYWIGLTELQVTGNRLVDGFAVQISEAWSNFFADLSLIDGEPEHVVVSYCHDGAWRTSAAVTLVTSYTTDPATDSQRRRLNGRGL